jgi:hypothetical protein
VRPDAKVCPKCGRFFSAVRCPNCGYTGEGREFTYGCPSCGYSGTGFRGEGRRTKGREEWYDAVDLDRAEPVAGPRRSARQRHREGPPAWAWWLALGLLSITFVIMVIIYIRLS